MDSDNYLSSSVQPPLVNTDRLKHFRKKTFDRDCLNSSSPRANRKFDRDESSSSEYETDSLNELKMKKKISIQRLLSSLSPQSDSASMSSSSSTISTESCLFKLLLQPILDQEIEPTPSPPTPRAPVPDCSPMTPERILHLKQQQIELDQTTEKLLNTIKYEGKKLVQQLSRYWAYIKQISLAQYQPKANPYQLFDYLMKSTSYNRGYELYFEQHDEIKAALQILSTILSIVHSEQSFCSIERIFDEEEKLMKEQLQSQLEFLISSHTDALSFIRERTRFYQSCPDGSRTSDWIQAIEIDYPLLIEKISNSSRTQMPSMVELLVLLLRTTKKHLLANHLEINANK